jgi:hypothetical protein
MWKCNRYNEHHKNREKGKHPNILEEYHIYKIGKDRLHMNEAYIDNYNQIFEALQESNTR